MRNAQIIPPLLWRTSEEVVLFGPPSTTEGGPRRTRRLRHGLSSEHGTPVSLYLRKHGLREILPPDALRSSESSRRQVGGGGGGHIVALLPFANSLRLSNERPSCFGFPAFVNLLVMNSVFNVNEFFANASKKNWGEGHFTTFHRKAYHV